MGDLKVLVATSLEGFKSDLTGHLSASSPPSPTYADVTGSSGSGESIVMFVDLPEEGEGARDIRGFKSSLEALLSNVSAKCNGIYPTKKEQKSLFRPLMMQR
ncbi:hypothetical protein JTE90_015733 [Oedothorax gibbosus]|uniref:Uncharacterized protein n=1 Tax=Oedothorax gibbosus TaxID=931172 RepID=A0AAV6TZ74_9ARAC|nr:hypothetical protein JTE90_015733 [Oedothorax gibbosus]